MTRMGLSTIIGLGLLLGASDLHAAPAREAPRAQARPRARKAPARTAPRHRSPPPRHTVGGYDGVTPGLPKMPKIHLPKKAASRCYLTWSGFQMLPTGSRLFLQFNRRPTYKTTVRAKSLSVTLPKCRVANWNNSRPLYTRYFPTPVRYSRVRRRRGALHLSVLLKRPASPRLRVVKLQGWYYLFVSFKHTRAAYAVKARPKKRRPRPRHNKPARGPRSP